MKEIKIKAANCEASMEGTILVLRIDTSVRLGRSKSGKTLMISTTNGNQEIEGHPDRQMRLGMNLYTK